MSAPPAILIAQFDRLVERLTALHGAIQQAQPPGGPHAAQWTRTAAQLQQELKRLSALGLWLSVAPASDADSAPRVTAHVLLKSTAVRLTQLARSHDGLSVRHASAAAAEQIGIHRRSVVFAAWQFLESLEKSTGAPSTHPPASAP
ncbi:MAG TPA: hypothetical protein VGD62_11835 [Acidobacteriaceae bacterium]